ncbi:GNAT family N-acetyltransferase [Subtercola sp. YIM 133946]|uniref:GNAT family N-acetyltransferase n=1 Tax=Subtercola sp. YIM 133946 TaxID=3118909 RepID=UPI002F95FF3D
MTVDYRRADRGDAARLALLAAATFPLACPDDAPIADVTDFIAAQLTEDRFADYLADAGRLLFVAEQDGLPIGYTMVILGEPNDPDVASAVTVRPTAELSKMYVFPGHHGSGVSAHLMELSVQAAADAGAGGVWLGVNDENRRANRFYEKNGFAIVGAKSFTLGSRTESDFVRERLLR